MEINRNQWFLVGMVLLILGIQFRMVDSYVLTPEFTEFLAARSGYPVAAAGAPTDSLAAAPRPTLRKTVRPPEFLGWALMSISATLILHSLAMKKPGT